MDDSSEAAPGRGRVLPHSYEQQPHNNTAAIRKNSSFAHTLGCEPARHKGTASNHGLLVPRWSSVRNCCRQLQAAMVGGGARSHAPPRVDAGGSPTVASAASPAASAAERFFFFFLLPSVVGMPSLTAALEGSCAAAASSSAPPAVLMASCAPEGRECDT